MTAPRPSADPIAAAVASACAAIDAAVAAGERAPSLDALALASHVSATHLRRVFVDALGVTPHAYADARRAERLRSALASGTPVADAIAGSGFGSASRVYERTGDLLGMTPSRARKGAPGERITYALADSSLGRLLVATTERGVCLVVFGDTADELIAEAHRRFPRATIEPAAREHAEWVSAVVSLVDAPADSARAAAVPLDAHGTVFQQQVWAALREIPPGQTVTYSQLAAAIGRPTAMRAVAQACGANPTAVVVPCHRVIGADGSLTGYRWGVERKRELLAREQR
ncbi:MAG: methylated-DNA--[protein]-cysteine S-methyltransferase [Coriobacteriia bacterium]|nr:methylated-DNA--[protein]-cysteine S-methyltransferase [Coriobacteriia bacterium]